MCVGMKNYVWVLFGFLLLSNFLVAQNLGMGIFGRLHPSVTRNNYFNNKYTESKYSNFLLTGLFISYRISQTSPTTFNLKYSFGQKQISDNPQYISAPTSMYLNLYSFEFSVLYGINIAKDLQLKAGIMPGVYYITLNDRLEAEKIYNGSKFSISPIANLSFNVFETINLDFSAIYSIEKIKIPLNEYYSEILGQWVSTNDFDEYDFKGFNFGLSVTYWIDL